MVLPLMYLQEWTSKHLVLHLVLVSDSPSMCPAERSMVSLHITRAVNVPSTSVCLPSQEAKGSAWDFTLTAAGRRSRGRVLASLPFQLGKAERGALLPQLLNPHCTSLLSQLEGGEWKLLLPLLQWFCLGGRRQSSSTRPSAFSSWEGRRCTGGGSLLFLRGSKFCTSKNFFPGGWPPLAPHAMCVEFGILID